MSSSVSCASKILRNNIQASWDRRWASPSTPTSLRMMSWMDLMEAERDMVNFRGSRAFVELRFQVAQGRLVLGAATESLNELDGRAQLREWHNFQCIR